jgi:molybdopterin molybdotransferase
MVTVEEATRIVLENYYQPVQIRVELTDAIGKVLAEPVVADRDLPPFDRVTMDGIAIVYERLANGQVEFVIEDIQAAGQPQKLLQNPRSSIEVMTGAMVPKGTDTIIRYEDLQIQNGIATIQNRSQSQGQNIHRRGKDARENQVMLEPGMQLSPAEIALLASVGKDRILVRSMPKTAIIGSGDELVDVAEKPQPFQIRRSNTYAVQAAMQQLRCPAEQCHFPDNEDTLLIELKKILEDHDLIILSGGVSKGKFDFIPEVLTELGVQKLFHEVSQRPGKPFWFGRTKSGKTVFALPGNPVSTFMCFHRYVKPWLFKGLGLGHVDSMAILASDFVFEPKLTHFLQVKIKNESGKLIAFPKAGGGSGDFANLKDVDGFLELPLQQTHFKAGEAYRFIGFR